MLPVGSHSAEEMEQNYVPMSANSPSHHGMTEPVHEANYVPMTPSTMEFSSLGKQVPPPAHMGFRTSPKTPPRRPMPSDCQPPPVDRNLKPDRKGEGGGARVYGGVCVMRLRSCDSALAVYVYRGPAVGWMSAERLSAGPVLSNANI